MPYSKGADWIENVGSCLTRDRPAVSADYRLLRVFFEFVVELLFRSRVAVDYYAKLEGRFFALVGNCLEFDVDDVLVGAPDFLFSPTESSVLVYLQAFSP